MPISPEARSALASVVRDAKIRVIGQDLVKNDAEAHLLAAITKAYGDSPAGFIYAAPSRARSTKYPPDVVLCHPEVGLLVIESKGQGIDHIEGVEAGSIMIRYRGHTRPDNVIRQAEDQMFEIKNDVLKLIRTARKMPLFNCIVAFPRISEGDWCAQGYDKAHPNQQLIFKEQIENQGRLKKRIGQLVQTTMKDAHKQSPLDLQQVEAIQRVFGNSDVINERRPPRAWVEKESLGCYIDEMVNLDKYLSEEQKSLSRMEFEGTQRLIRGVAGSGKSIVLANLVARFLHRKLDSLQESFWPEEEISIAVTCFNRSLVDFLKQKVRTAYREQTLNEDIPSNVLLVTHLNRLMYNLIHQRGWPLEYVRIAKGNANERARNYREQVRNLIKDNPELYRSICMDAVFVDEGQDFEPEEYRLLLDLVKPHPVTKEKPIVIFYDDAQNLYGRPRPVWEELGIHVVGGRADVMRECFRNPRQIIELAFNVLLGSQAPENIRVQTRTYADVAYLKDRGLVEEVGDHFRVGFAEREDVPPEIVEHTSESEEINWLVEKIGNLIQDEGVRPEDILVVFYRPDCFGFETLQGALSNRLPELSFIMPFGNKNEDKDRYIFQSGHLTISTVYGAKGYDAPIVFLVGADRFDVGKEGRAGFYVAATRAKFCLFISGVGGRESLLHEAAEIRKVI